MAKLLFFCVFIASIFDSAFFFGFESFKKSIHLADHLRESGLPGKAKTFTFNSKDSLEKDVPTFVHNAVDTLTHQRLKRHATDEDHDHHPESSKVSTVHSDIRWQTNYRPYDYFFCFS